MIIERLVGAAILQRACRRIIHWAADPRVDAAVLRRALADALAADALTAPLSESMKLEYLICLRDLEELRVMVDEIPLPGGQERLAREGRQRRRERNLSCSGSGCRRPTTSSEAGACYGCFTPTGCPRWIEPAASASPDRNPEANRDLLRPTRTLRPRRACDRSGRPRQRRSVKPCSPSSFRPSHWSEAQEGRPPWSGWAWRGHGSALAREPRRRSVLIVKLAAVLTFDASTGSFPPMPGSLLNGYLKELPVGVKPDEPIPAGID